MMMSQASQSSNNANTAMMMEEAKRRLVKAALVLLPGTLTAAYSVALLHSPDLVEKESDPCWFLQCERGNFQKAAFKLSMYWSKRFIYFGALRAYRPFVLNLNGNGDTGNEATALSTEDLAALPACCLQPLPPDSQGRAVYWISSARAVNNFSTEADIRCLFYQLQLANGGISALHGIVVLLLVDEEEVENCNSSTNSNSNNNNNIARLSTLLCLISELLTTAIPFYIRHLHILSRNPTSENVAFAISSVVKLAMDKGLCQELTIEAATSSTSPQEGILGKLVPFGMSPHGLPPELGGTYAPMLHASAASAASTGATMGPEAGMVPEVDMVPAKATIWAPQLAVATRYCSSSSSSSSSSHDLPGPLLWGHGGKLAAESVDRVLMPAPPQEKQEQDDRKRKATSSCSMKRNKPAAATPPPRQPPEGRQLAASYASLMNELPCHYASVAGMIASPDDAVSSIHNDLLQQQEAAAEGGGTLEEQEAAKKAMVRKRNALYSRRKYVRRRIEIEVMEDQRSNLVAKNASLLREQRRLEALVAAAMQCVVRGEEQQASLYSCSSSFGHHDNGNNATSSSPGHAQSSSLSSSRLQELPSAVNEDPAERRLQSTTRLQERAASTMLIAAALARHQRQRQHGGPPTIANGLQVVGQATTTPTAVATAAAATATGGEHAPAVPMSHNVTEPPFSKGGSSLAADTSAIIGNSAPPTRSEFLARSGGNIPVAALSDLSSLISLLTRGGPNPQVLSILGSWGDAATASLTAHNTNTSNVTSAASAAASTIGIVGGSHVRPLEPRLFSNSTITMLHSSGVMPSSLLTRPYMLGSRDPAPLLPNAHFSCSSSDDNS
jgi:hypothetical protein